jgi:hypothetical protein
MQDGKPGAAGQFVLGSPGDCFLVGTVGSLPLSSQGRSLFNHALPLQVTESKSDKYAVGDTVTVSPLKHVRLSRRAYLPMRLRWQVYGKWRLYQSFPAAHPMLNKVAPIPGLSPSVGTAYGLYHSLRLNRC